MIIKLKGNVPSKKNSKRRVQRGAHVFMIPSEAHEKWHKIQMAELQKPRLFVPIARISECCLTFFHGDRRKNDLSNKAESVMDLLVDAGILEDDNWFVVPRLSLEFGGVDKENPRVVIRII